LRLFSFGGYGLALAALAPMVLALMTATHSNQRELEPLVLPRLNTHVKMLIFNFHGPQISTFKVLFSTYAIARCHLI